ncbi:MAG: ABC transporter ATP-binding protein [Candidatus Heimdallarchaeota archaeon]
MSPLSNTEQDFAIRTEHLTKKFNGLMAVFDLNLAIPAGIVYGLLGPNASGKTTTIRMLIGRLKPTTGTIKIFGKPIPAQLKSLSTDFGYMPQARAIYYDLSGRENLVYFGTLYGLAKAEIENRIEELTEIMDLEPHLGKVTRYLSGGTQQRLSLACTLMHQPRLLFLDEPTIGIDPELRYKFWGWFKEMAKTLGTTLIVTTHYCAEAENCDVVGLLREGSLIVEDTPSALKEEFNVETLEEVFIKVAQGVS